MKAGSLRLVVQAAVLAVFMPGVGFAGELQDKIEYCTNCHGTSGQGFRGFYIAPRLAGQQVEYLENQFKAILAHRRDNPIAQTFMVPVMESVEPGMRAAIAKHFNQLDPRPAGGGPRNLVAAGKKIFEEGIPDENVPACAACHGPEAKGNDAVPRLAGQFYPYLVAQLKGWSKGYRKKDPVNAGDDNIMLPIATALTGEQIAAVSAYLSYQR